VHYVYNDIDFSKVGVNDMPFFLKYVLNGCIPHMEITLMGP